MQQTLALLETVSALNQAGLERLLRTRFTNLPAKVTDLFALVDALLKPEIIRQSLRQLTQKEIDALLWFYANPNVTNTAEADQLTADLASIGLLGTQNGSYIALEAVTKQLHSLLNESQKNTAGALLQLSDSTPKSAEADHNDWALNAFSATQKSVLVLREIALAKPELKRDGGLRQAEAQRIAQRLNISPHQSELHFLALKTAGLIGCQHVPNTNSLFADLADDAKDWAILPHAKRWVALISKLFANAPAGLQPLLAARGNTKDKSNAKDLSFYGQYTQYLRDRPLLPAEDLAAINTYVLLLKTFGVLDTNDFTAAAMLLLCGEEESATKETQNAMPKASSSVVIQPDFSVIAPNPLEPEVGLELLRLANIEHAGVATTLHISKESLEAALSSGNTVKEIKKFLQGISITPLPQPLDFLLNELEEAGPIDRQTGYNKHLNTNPVRAVEVAQKTTTWAAELAFKLTNQLDDVANATIVRTLEVAKRAKLAVLVRWQGQGQDEVNEAVLIPIAISANRLRARQLDEELERIVPISAVLSASLAPTNKQTR